LPDADAVIAAEYEEKVFPTLAVSDTTYLIIVTRGHRDDMRVLAWAAQTNARYLAMIGSKRKVIGVVEELAKSGFPAAALERLYAPMGFEHRRHYPGRDRPLRRRRDDRRPPQP
jgi:xanthine dehydrogenase accessory factor